MYKKYFQKDPADSRNYYNHKRIIALIPVQEETYSYYEDKEKKEIFKGEKVIAWTLYECWSESSLRQAKECTDEGYFYNVMHGQALAGDHIEDSEEDQADFFAYGPNLSEEEIPKHFAWYYEEHKK